MNRRTNEKFIILLATLASAGMIIENILVGWEFWVPPVILAGIASLWAVNLSERIDYEIRKSAYFGYAVLLLFYHGVHKSSFFDISLAVILVMVTYAILNSFYMMNVLLLEFFILLFIHFLNLPGGDPINFSRVNVSRILLHTAIVLLVFYTSCRTIQDRLEDEEESRIKEERITANDNSTEDFLTNISHELRTPVNVVNGMSDLLIKKGAGYEADTIKNAGIRLAYQIEDIQDYTECRRGNVFLEEDGYMSTSLINDVVASFGMNGKNSDLELIVDLDPNVPSMMKGDIRKLHKIFRHLLENAVKFTRKGGIYIKMYTEQTEYGVNLCIEVTDTGIGMNRNDILSLTEGMYQANKKRNRSSGGIGLGLYIVYGFTHRMGGFVKIESEKHNGTTVRVTIPQNVVDDRPCLKLDEAFEGTVLFHVKPDKYKIPKIREFYRNMASNLAEGIHIPLYSADTLYEVERLMDRINVSYIFMGQEEYEENRGYFDELAEKGIVVAASVEPGFMKNEDSRVVLIPKPLYAYPIMKVFSDGADVRDSNADEGKAKPVFKDVKALIVDDEPMNLVVASWLFRDYEMIIDTADSGREAIRKFHDNDYDLVFMDHMMPEMDGVEAMKQIKALARDLDREIKAVALTANVVSGAREMFIQEGFDGFIAKPINTADFERVMLRILPGSASAEGGGRG
ncbi:MAG: response regulator [Lachnospiraceae bacterium]|nr:response regulator [Lachnospiraceae bacterium]